MSIMSFLAISRSIEASFYSLPASAVAAQALAKTLMSMSPDWRNFVFNFTSISWFATSSAARNGHLAPFGAIWRAVSSGVVHAKAHLDLLAQRVSPVSCMVAQGCPSSTQIVARVAAQVRLGLKYRLKMSCLALLRLARCCCEAARMKIHHRPC